MADFILSIVPADGLAPLPEPMLNNNIGQYLQHPTLRSGDWEEYLIWV